ncbi:MAG: Sensor protein resE [Candidatus Saccharibacteria bacterium]|nr:Sensor protein resE [Candidatus Saccharibacteria bacterium]
MDLILLIVTVVINLSLGLIVLVRDNRAAPARLFGLMSFLICAWIVTNFVTNHNDWGNLAVNDISNRLAFFAGFGIVLSGLLFTYVFPTARDVKRFEKLSVIIIAIFILGLSMTDSVAGRVTLTNNESLVFSVGSFLWIYALAFLFMVVLLAKNLASTIRKGNTIKKRQAILILAAFCSSALLGLILNVILPLLGLTWETTRLGPVVTVALVAIIAYTIVKHGLFDIRFAAVRSVVYIFSLLTLSIIYYFLAYIVSVTIFQGEISSTVSISPINIFLALLLAFIFQPIKSFFDKTTDSIFYRGRYNTDEFYARLSEVLTTTTDLRNLLERASNEIGTTLKAEQAFFFVQYNHVHHVTAGTKRHTSLPLADAHRLNEYVKKEGHDIIVTELLLEDHTIHRMLISHRVAIMMPIMRGSSILGYLALGEQRSSGYTNRDIKVLKTISDELVIAIQNSLSVEEVKDINIHLQQRINAATTELRTSNTQLRHLDKTKDEFLSMASHQLRTPLTSVKGYLSMVLEGDAGKVSETQKQLLGEAFSSSERMVHLIHDFLNVSRLQTGKFMLELHPYDIVKLVEEEVRSLERTAETRNMKLKLVNTIDHLILNIDENKIRQVVMNFIDNALFYSHDDSVITVELKEVDGQVELRVIDTGIGVPKGEQAQLFSKFYRASNARKQRPDGTGVGIFLAKKVVTEHGGDVLFESEEGKGSIFGFTLPIEKLAVPLYKETDKLE